jgi:predicted metal-dependent hydrolase
MKLIEPHSLQYGSTIIRYTLEYRARKTLAIEVHPDSSVHIKAPHNVALESIRDKVSKRAAWITKQQKQFAQYAPSLPAQEYVSGEGYRYLGRQYRLKVLKGTSEYVRLWQGKIEVSTQDPEDCKRVSKLVNHWCREQSQRVFQERYKICIKQASQHHIQHESGFELRSMPKRWGSCTKEGKILLNPLLISAPKDCIDYVIIHELCHTLQHNHSKHFFMLLNTLMPNWQTRKQYLNTRIELRPV